MKRKKVQLILQTIYLKAKGKLAYVSANKHCKNENFAFLNLDFINETIDGHLAFLGKNYQNHSSEKIQSPAELIEIITGLVNKNEWPTSDVEQNQDIIFYLGEYESFLLLSALQDDYLVAKFLNGAGNLDISFEIPLVGNAESAAANRFLKQMVALNKDSIRFQINTYLDLASFRKETKRNILPVQKGENIDQLTPEKEKDIDELSDILQNILKPIQQLKYINNIYLFNRNNESSTSSIAIDGNRIEGKSTLFGDSNNYLANLFLKKDINFISEPINPDAPIPKPKTEPDPTTKWLNNLLDEKDCQ